MSFSASRDLVSCYNFSPVVLSYKGLVSNKTSWTSCICCLDKVLVSFYGSMLSLVWRSLLFVLLWWSLELEIIEFLRLLDAGVDSDGIAPSCSFCSCTIYCFYFLWAALYSEAEGIPFWLMVVVDLLFSVEDALYMLAAGCKLLTDPATSLTTAV